MTTGMRWKSAWALAACVALFWTTAARAAKPLRIHYINIGQGGATLIVGPNGTSILYDFGLVPGDQSLVPFLRDTVRIKPETGVDYTMVSHNDKDHYYGFKAFVEASYDVKIKNYSSGSTKTTKMVESHWFAPAKRTSAGAVTGIPVGLRIALGDGAEAIVVGANGHMMGLDKPVAIKDENDKSIALFITYGGFQYIIDGDLGSGPEPCTKHDTGQRGVQQVVAQALLDQGLMTEDHGVDVLHIAHHGSESSTAAAYYNLMRPEVGLISVGQNQGSFLHPRRDVVDLVLMGDSRAECVTAPPLQALFQTENGVEGCSSTGYTSFSGHTLGDITLSTDGRTGYTITGNNRVHHDFDPKTMSREETSFTFPFDEDGDASADPDFDENFDGNSGENFDEELQDPTPCCKRCRPGISKPCGDACIREADTCQAESGCACGG